MVKKTLRLKVKEKHAKPLDEKAGSVSRDDAKKRFLNGVAVNPSPCIRLELGSQQLTTRAMDLLSPIGMGQRGLIVAPPGSGKTTILKHIC